MAAAMHRKYGNMLADEAAIDIASHVGDNPAYSWPSTAPCGTRWHPRQYESSLFAAAPTTTS